MKCCVKSLPSVKTPIVSVRECKLCVVRKWVCCGRDERENTDEREREKHHHSALHLSFRVDKEKKQTKNNKHREPNARHFTVFVGSAFCCRCFRLTSTTACVWEEGTTDRQTDRRKEARYAEEEEAESEKSRRRRRRRHPFRQSVHTRDNVFQPRRPKHVDDEQEQPTSPPNAVEQYAKHEQ